MDELWRKAELWLTYYCVNWNKETQVESGECARAYSELYSAYDQLNPSSKYERSQTERFNHMKTHCRAEIEEYLIKRRLNGG